MSLAEAERVTLAPETVALLSGAVSDTVGATSSLLTVIVRAVEVATLPAASRATAMSVFDSDVVAVESHTIEYGALSSVPISTPCI